MISNDTKDYKIMKISYQDNNDDFAKGIDMKPLAETWECSTQPDGLSYIASREYNGKTLLEVLKMHSEYLGIHKKAEGKLAEGEFPILIKFIDAKLDLFVQVV